MSQLEEIVKALVIEVVDERVGSLSLVRKARPLLDAEEAGKLLGGLDKQTVYRLAREGQLRPIYISKTRFRFQEEEIERFIREGGVRKSCLKEVPAHKVQRGR